MKRLKLFPKFFLYTLGIMLFIVAVSHGLIYLLAPRMQLSLSTQDDIRRIRTKLAKATSKNYIETVWGCGYKWVS